MDGGLGGWIGSCLPALGKEKVSLHRGLGKDRTGTEPFRPSKLAGTSIRPSSQACVGNH